MCMSVCVVVDTEYKTFILVWCCAELKVFGSSYHNCTLLTWFVSSYRGAHYASIILTRCTLKIKTIIFVLLYQRLR